MKPLDECRLYAFADAGYLRGRAPADVVRQLCDGGADLVQWRAKGWSRDDVQRVAEQLLAVTEPAGVGLVINDHPAVAAAVGAPLCHLGQEDFFDAGYHHVSQLIGPASAGLSAGSDPTSTSQQSPAVGLSSHAPVQAERAVGAGAAYVAIGPVYATPTKPGRAPVTLEYVRWAAANLRVPWFAIGGITQANLEEVLAAGARRICIVSGILNAPVMAEACREFRRRLASA